MVNINELANQHLRDFNAWLKGMRPSPNLSNAFVNLRIKSERAEVKRKVADALYQGSLLSYKGNSVLKK